MVSYKTFDSFKVYNTNKLEIYTITILHINYKYMFKAYRLLLL